MIHMPRFVGLLLALVVPSLTTAQPPGNVSALSPVPPAPPGPETSGATPPSWLVWRAFHDSVEFYSRRSPIAAAGLFAERAGLTTSEAQSVVTAGRDYLEQLTMIDEKARAEIRARYEFSLRPPQPVGPSQRQPVLTPRAPPNRASLPAHLMPGQLSDGRTLRDAAEADGVIRSVQQQRAAALDAHLERIAQLIGVEKLEQLGQWLQADVAINVSVVTNANRVPAPAADPPRTAPFLSPR